MVFRCLLFSLFLLAGGLTVGCGGNSPDPAPPEMPPPTSDAPSEGEEEPTLPEEGP